jgi:hypothetical protein
MLLEQKVEEKENIQDADGVTTSKAGANAMPNGSRDIGAIGKRARASSLSVKHLTTDV